MKRLEIRLLGGFEVRRDGAVVGGFESQKARALLAFLALHPDEKIPRERLANLLWSERPDDSARRNLRQALYSLRSVLNPDRGETAVFGGGQHNLGFDPDLELWVDVAAFREAIARGSTERGDDPRHLAAAARLYRGDLLAGFYLRDCPPYEEWLLGQQEALREEAVEALKTLVAAYLSRGESRFGIQYAKRLLAIDPLSEEAHRQLIRLYLVAGRRNSALAHYEHLRNLLNAELGVEPLPETADLYRSILLETQEKEELVEPQPVGPLIPLVARSEVFNELHQAWNRVLEGSGRLTLITGSPGIGKTRAMRSFVDVATSKRDAIVLRGRSFHPAPLISYGVFTDILSGAWTDVLPYEETTRERLSPEAIQRLVSMAPDTATILQESLGIEVAPGATDAEASLEALIELLDAMSPPGTPEGRPTIFMIDDLQWGDRPSLDLLAGLVGELAKRRVWILATANGRPDSPLFADPPPADLADSIDLVHLTPLTYDDLSELTEDLFDPENAGPLATFLWERSEGLPLLLAEIINYLWDTGVLETRSPSQWQLNGDPQEVIPEGIELADLIRKRYQRLPASTRRLLALAAVGGQQFDVELVRLAGDEHTAVVEICVELALERWLIRQHPRRWSHAGMEQDLVLWARGARRGYFEFAHRGVREAILGAVNPLRRQVMHREVAGALAELYPDDPAPVCESLAYHELGAGAPERALPWLERAMERAAATGGAAVAEIYRERAAEIVGRLLQEATEEPERHRLEEQAARLRVTPAAG